MEENEGVGGETVDHGVRQGTTISGILTTSVFTFKGYYAPAT